VIAEETDNTSELAKYSDKVKFWWPCPPKETSHWGHAQHLIWASHAHSPGQPRPWQLQPASHHGHSAR
jgi:hypothetical protein